MHTIELCINQTENMSMYFFKHEHSHQIIWAYHRLVFYLCPRFAWRGVPCCRCSARGSMVAPCLSPWTLTLVLRVYARETSDCLALTFESWWWRGYLWALFIVVVSPSRSYRMFACEVSARRTWVANEPIPWSLISSPHFVCIGLWRVLSQFSYTVSQTHKLFE